MNVEEMPQGSGSGIVWDSAGHIVTNFHVIRSATSAQVPPNSSPALLESKALGVARFLHQHHRKSSPRPAARPFPRSSLGEILSLRAPHRRR